MDGTKNDLSRRAWLLNDIGGTYSAAGNRQLALDNYTKAVELAKGAKNYEAETAAWNNVGTGRSMLKQYVGRQTGFKPLDGGGQRQIGKRLDGMDASNFYP